MIPKFQDRGRPRLSIHVAIQFLTLCLVLFAARGAWAQANAGVTGTVTDQSGAVIPNANVTITNEGTSISNKRCKTSGAVREIMILGLLFNITTLSTTAFTVSPFLK